MSRYLKGEKVGNEVVIINNLFQSMFTCILDNCNAYLLSTIRYVSVDKHSHDLTIHKMILI